MKKFIKKIFSRNGFISIEIVIIASVCLIGGIAGTSSFLKNGQSAQNRSAKAVNDTIDMIGEEFGFVGEEDVPEIQYETRWYYGDLELPELPKELTDEYSWYTIGTAYGYTALAGVSLPPSYYGYFSSNSIYDPVTDSTHAYSGNCLQWYDGTVHLDAYILIDNNWVHLVHDENHSDGDGGSYQFFTADKILWVSHDVYNEDGTLFMQGIEPVQRQVQVK